MRPWADVSEQHLKSCAISANPRPPRLLLALVMALVMLASLSGCSALEKAQAGYQESAARVAQAESRVEAASAQIESTVATLIEQADQLKAAQARGESGEAEQAAIAAGMRELNALTAKLEGLVQVRDLAIAQAQDWQRAVQDESSPWWEDLLYIAGGVLGIGLTGTWAAKRQVNKVVQTIQPSMLSKLADAAIGAAPGLLQSMLQSRLTTANAMPVRQMTPEEERQLAELMAKVAADNQEAMKERAASQPVQWGDGSQK